MACNYYDTEKHIVWQEKLRWRDGGKMEGGGGEYHLCFMA